MLLYLRAALDRSVGFETFLAQFGLQVRIISQIASKELDAFRIAEEDFAWFLLLARFTFFLGRFGFVGYDSIALRVEHVCELILFGLTLPLSDEALQLSSLEDVPYQEVGAEIHLL